MTCDSLNDPTKRGLANESGFDFPVAARAKQRMKSGV